MGGGSSGAGGIKPMSTEEMLEVHITKAALEAEEALRSVCPPLLASDGPDVPK